LIRTLRVEAIPNKGSALHGEQQRKGQAAMAAAAAAAFVIDKKAAQTMSALQAAEQQISDIPYGLKNLCRDPLGASALLYSLLLDADTDISRRQMAYISSN
jgi:hypothetical protein